MNIRNIAIIAIGALLLLTSCARPMADFILPTSEPEAPAEVRFQNTSKKGEIY